MHIKRKFGWEIPESQVTDQKVYMNRRQLLKGLGASGLMLGACDDDKAEAEEKTEEKPKEQVAQKVEENTGENTGDKLYELTRSYYPAERNAIYKVEERPLTGRDFVLRYNNFYEFGSHKYIWETAQRLQTHPWEVVIDGEVETPLRMDVTELLAKMPLEQRIYRLRCVEAWAMTVPWEGFALKELVKLARPLSSARYLEMETLADKNSMPGLRQVWYPWPYTEALTLEEAAHDLSFIATGVYGEPMPKQNGAPLRLAVPWKYGFKSVKSLVRFTFTSEKPVSFWEKLQPKEYGFWANVNPKVRHPRWSQATERLLGEDRRVETQLYNGYGEFVAELYAGMDREARTLWF